jgi:SAM-dependent methyltransferase
MEPQTDPYFLLSEEYNEATALNTRIEIQARFSLNRYGWFHWLFDQLQLPEDGRILELGCGPGHLWTENLNRLPAGWQLVLTDFSEGMIEEARHQLDDRPNFTFQLLDAQAIALPDNHFDAVLANGIYDHIPHRKQAFAETLRVLKPGGRLYASAGGRYHLHQLEALVRPFVPDADYGGAPERFGLENGEALLSAWFNDVKQSLYEDTLIFRDAYPIVAYLLSEAAVRPRLTGPRLRDMLRHIQNTLAAEGEIHVTLQKGLFTAHKAPTPLPALAGQPDGQQPATGAAGTSNTARAALFRPWCIANCARYNHRTITGRRRLSRRQNGRSIQPAARPSFIIEPLPGASTPG